MAHVIVIGAGLGGIPAAFDLRKHLGKNHRVTLIGARPYFEFTPSNPWIAVGWRTPKETQVQMQTPLDNKGVEWLVNTVTKIDAENSKLTLDDGKELCLRLPRHRDGTAPRLRGSARVGSRGLHPVGVQPGPFGAGVGKIPGVPEKSRTHHRWRRARRELLRSRLRNRHGHRCGLRKRKLRDRVPMTYVTSEPYIGHMGLGGVGDSKGLMESELRERHIKWITNAKMTSVTANEMTVQELDRGRRAQEGAQATLRLQRSDSGIQGRRCGRRGTGTVQSARLRA